ncbi:MAG: PQQ-binding-like beta-propeller repeat protein [Spirochaetes bacterium]|jgi:outer membrane protein OmpA-like peptidoglycan-associated protein|nr:PQQ-binding-like beta-propeller repeat protein [Spirochaetota bacterium]
MIKIAKKVTTVVVLVLFFTALAASDWPVYKGNIYFTGNNDEIVVPNGNLKWLYQAEDRVFNPIVSDGFIYFIDQKANLYCLNENSGKIVWKISVRDISAQFRTLSKSAGKIKYPLIKGDYIYLTDPVAVYCLDKKTGRVIWARTAYNLKDSAAMDVKKGDLTARVPNAMIDGIYSDPVLSGNEIFYGTRKVFVSRDNRSGNEKWKNSSIKSFSGFPTFYDDGIIVQSMDYQTMEYKVVLLEGKTGKTIWEKRLPQPFKIFPPVVYKRRVYIPVSKTLYCLDLDNGKKLWKREYGGIISSMPGFTDRAVIFTLDNNKLVVTNPDNGAIENTIDVADKSSPGYVMVRDQFYIAYNEKGSVNRAYGIVRAINYNDKSELWRFKTPFPGAVSQPIASNGILFLPAGNYLYAIGAEAYPRVVSGGSSVYGAGGEPDEGKKSDSSEDFTGTTGKAITSPDDHSMKFRDFELDVTGKDGGKIPAYVDIEQKDSKGRPLYKDRKPVTGGKVKIPDGDNVHVVVGADGYIPEGFDVGKGEKKRKVELEKIESGKTYVVKDVTFEYNKAYLRKSSLPILHRLLEIMTKNPGLKLEIRGHTDNVGDKNYNQKLSERRADAVNEFMVKNGISPERLMSRGFGESEPIAPNNTEEGRQKNRRTEFIFTD